MYKSKSSFRRLPDNAIWPRDSYLDDAPPPDYDPDPDYSVGYPDPGSTFGDVPEGKGNAYNFTGRKVNQL